MKFRLAVRMGLTTWLCLAAAAAYAQDSGDEGSADANLDLTMTLMPEDAELPDAVTKVIALPGRAAGTEAGARTQGRDRANQARQNRTLGLEAAEQAREAGQAIGEAVRELARESRETRGRGERPETTPRPNPGPPDVPGPPQN